MYVSGFFKGVNYRSKDVTQVHDPAERSGPHSVADFCLVFVLYFVFAALLL